MWSLYAYQYLSFSVYKKKLCFFLQIAQGTPSWFVLGSHRDWPGWGCGPRGSLSSGRLHPLLRPPGAIPSRSPPEATVCSFRSQKPKGFLGDFLLPILETVVDPVGIWGFSFFNFSLRNTENDLDLHLIFLLNKKMERTWLPEAVRGRSGDRGLDSGR